MEHAFHQHFDLGVVRETPGSLNFEAWQPDGAGGCWHAVDFDAFSASMSSITEEMAAERIPRKHLHAPADERAYAKLTRENLARAGIHTR